MKKLILILPLFFLSCGSKVESTQEVPKAFNVESFQEMGFIRIYVLVHKETSKKFLLTTKNSSVSIIPFEEK